MTLKKIHRCLKVVCVFHIVCYSGLAQPIPEVKFNHLYMVLNVEDMKAINNNEILKNKITALETRTTHAEGGEHWTGTYFYGQENYLEFFDTTGYSAPLGHFGIGLSVDRPGDLIKLRALLNEKFKVELSQRKLKIKDGSEIPWFDALIITDKLKSVSCELWIMEYKPSFFEYINRVVTDEKLTRRIYLKKFDSLRQDKFVHNFTKVTLKLSADELSFFTTLFKTLGYQDRKGEFISPDGFHYQFLKRKLEETQGISMIEFNIIDKVKKGHIDISKNITIEIDSKKGFIKFNSGLSKH